MHQQQDNGPLNSPVVLAGLALVILLAVAALVFALGTVFLDDDGDTEATGSSDTTTPGDNPDDPGDGDQSDGGDQDGTDQGDGSSGNGDGDDDGSDDDATTTTGGTTLPTNTVAPDPDCPGADIGFEIEFDAGTFSTTVDDVVRSGQADLYTLGVAEQQFIVIRITTPNPDLELTIKAPDGSITDGPPEETVIAPTQAGDYVLCLTATGGDVGYELEVAVRDDNSPTKISAPWCGQSVNDRGEIRFAPGTSSGDVEQSVIRGERDLYRFEAAQGQFIDLLMTSLEDNAEFSFRAPGGDLLIAEVSDFRIPLPESGVYQICVVGTRGNATYELAVAIE